MHGLLRVLRHPLNVDRSLLTFGHVTSGSATTYLSTVDGILCSATKGYRMIRPGRVISVTAQVDITALTPVAFLTLSVFADGSSVGSPTPYNSSGADQVEVLTLAPPARFAAQSAVAVNAVVFGTLTFDDLIVTVEVELER